MKCGTNFTLKATRSYLVIFCSQSQQDGLLAKISDGNDTGRYGHVRELTSGTCVTFIEILLVECNKDNVYVARELFSVAVWWGYLLYCSI
jgi:hypothetical protein